MTREDYVRLYEMLNQAIASGAGWEAAWFDTHNSLQDRETIRGLKGLRVKEAFLHHTPILRPCTELEYLS